MKRDAEGYRIDETWDALGMRATRSDDAILEGVFIRDEDVAYVVPAGAAGMNLFVLAISEHEASGDQRGLPGSGRCHRRRRRIRSLPGRPPGATLPRRPHGPAAPGNFALTYELIAKVNLGIDLDGSPRWG